MNYNLPGIPEKDKADIIMNNKDSNNPEEDHSHWLLQKYSRDFLKQVILFLEVICKDTIFKDDKLYELSDWIGFILDLEPYKTNYQKSIQQKPYGTENKNQSQKNVKLSDNEKREVIKTTLNKDSLSDAEYKEYLTRDNEIDHMKLNYTMRKMCGMDIKNAELTLNRRDLIELRKQTTSAIDGIIDTDRQEQIKFALVAAQYATSAGQPITTKEVLQTGGIVEPLQDKAIGDNNQKVKCEIIDKPQTYTPPNTIVDKWIEEDDKL